ncbi:insulin-induced gene 1 protein isoform X4 [Mirounga angustirostris]|uniref:insulin-induced gene 1 protein isoform X4 n=1 Tax=Mirounga angustirostris TaxID=9716 RepID=UPI00313E42F4
MGRAPRIGRSRLTRPRADGRAGGAGRAGATPQAAGRVGSRDPGPRRPPYKLRRAPRATGPTPGGPGLDLVLPRARAGAPRTAVVGLLYPCIDSHLGEPHKFKREWASVMRCVAVFVGINHASAKLDFANNVQLSLTLAALSLGLWWTFDRSRSGLGLGITIAFLATLITQLLVYNGVYQYTSPDFLYIRSWLPCIFFSGGVTVGNIGRQLAMGVPEKPHSD